MDRAVFLIMLLLSSKAAFGTRRCYECTGCKTMTAEVNSTECSGPCYTKQLGEDVERHCSLATELVLYPNIPCFLAMENAEEFTMCYCNTDLCNNGFKVTSSVTITTIIGLSIWKLFTL